MTDDEKYLWKTVSQMRDRLDALEHEVRRLGGTVGAGRQVGLGDQEFSAVEAWQDQTGEVAAAGRTGASAARFDAVEAGRLFIGMTVKQHVAAQIIGQYGGNADIAEVLGVGLDGAKGHVRALARKTGVRKRAQMAQVLREAFAAVRPEEYARMSGGLPIDWWQNHSHPDPWYELYRREERALSKPKGVK